MKIQTMYLNFKAEGIDEVKAAIGKVEAQIKELKKEVKKTENILKEIEEAELKIVPEIRTGNE